VRRLDEAKENTRDRTPECRDERTGAISGEKGRGQALEGGMGTGKQSQDGETNQMVETGENPFKSAKKARVKASRDPTDGRFRAPFG